MAMFRTPISLGPLPLLKHGTRRISGPDARMSNIAVAGIIAEVLRTTLGPCGMNKILVSARNELQIATSGAAILKEIDKDPAGFRLKHPVAKMMLDAAKMAAVEVGDGTATTVVLIGEMLRQAESLLLEGVHPSTIISGYRKAAVKASQLLDELSSKVDLSDLGTLRNIAATSMNGRAIGVAKNHFANIAVRAAMQIADKKAKKNPVDIDHANIVKKRGKSLLDTELIQGVILDDNFVVLPSMPKRLRSAKVALIWCPITIEKTSVNPELRIRTPSDIKMFLSEDRKIFESIVNRIKKCGAKVVVCQKKEVDDLALHLFARKGIMVVRRATEKEMRNLARSTGGKIVMDINDFKRSDLGQAQLVEEKKIGISKMVFVKAGGKTRSVSVLIRGGFERVLEEAQGAIETAVRVISEVLKDNRVLPGGGAVEVEIGRRLLQFGMKFPTREQLSIRAFASSLEVIPKALAENAGLDLNQILTSLRAAHVDASGISCGVDVARGGVEDMRKLGVLEPLSVKKYALKIAAETAIMILRVDDFIAAKKIEVGLTGP